jgi:protocatechuate 3,4-dioxygenase beta subunit
MSLLGPLAYMALSIAVVLRSMPPAGALIEGRVTDTQGKPIAAASVWLREADIPLGPEDPEEFGTPAAKTDTGGRFRLTGLTAGAQVHLRIEHAGYAPLEVPGVEAPTREALRLEMKTARGLAGRVLGPDGEPVADATLKKGGFSLSDASLSMSDRPVLGRTDARGAFRIGGLEPGPFDLRITSREYATQRVHGIPIPQDRDLEGFEIVLERGTILEVRVLSTEGTPVLGAVVRAEPKELRTLTLADLEQMDGLFGATDKRGIVRLMVPSPAPWRVVASMPGRSISILVQAVKGTTRVDLRFPSGVEVSGRVTDPQGQGIANAAVDLTAEQNDPQSTMTGEDGAFVFRQVPDGVFRLTARRQGFIQAGEPREVAVAGKGIRDLGIQLEPKPGVTLTGHLLGLNPSEIQAASVHAFGGEGTATATVGPDGRYEIRDLQSGDWNVLVATGIRSMQRTAQIQAGDSSPVLDIDFGKGFTLTGRVAMDGAPLSGATIQVVSPPSGQVSAQTNYEGRFVVRNLAPGPHFVMVLATRGITGHGQPVTIEGDTEVTIDIPAGVLTGRVVSAGTGEPVSGASVQIMPQGQEQQIPPAFSIAAIHSGADGHFESRLADGTYQILVQKEGYAPAEATAEVRHDTAGAVVEIRLKPAGAP